jgi:hypothetical protein
LANLLQEAFGAVSGSEFDETPVPVEKFVTDILHHPPLSDIQTEIVKNSTQIFKQETLWTLYGMEEGEKIWKNTKTEIICALGKGSGKDQMAKISCLYVVYLLLCLKNPQKYFNKPEGDYIDIMNIAVNADQANRVFFTPLIQMLKRCEWFDGKFDDTRNEVTFDKLIRLTSGNSEGESLEGYNSLIVILDEISGFALESATGNQQAKTGPAIFKTHRGAVSSRFPKVGKVILLSFPRYEGDFIMQRYEKAVASKETLVKRHTFKRDPDLPDGFEGNEFQIEWEEDVILRYNRPRVYAIKRPSWEVNPTKEIDDYVDDFDDDLGDALTRFAAMPTTSMENAVFKNHEKIESAFALTNGVDEDGAFYDGFKPKKGVKYFMHVDLAQKHDRCVVAMAHVEEWVDVRVGGKFSESYPFVVIDAIRWWQPTKQKSIEFSWVIEYILAVRRRGFDIKLVTFDRWNAHDTRNSLERLGIKTEQLSVKTEHYTDFKSILYDERLVGPNIPELHQEMKELMFIKDKVDHPRKGFKDLCDASCGAIVDAVAGTPKPTSRVVEAKTAKDLRKEKRAEDAEKKKWDNVIVAPKRPKEMPKELKNYLAQVL